MTPTLDTKALEAAAMALHARYEEISHWVRTLKNAPRSLEDSGLRDIYMLDASAAVSAYLAALAAQEPRS